MLRYLGLSAVNDHEKGLEKEAHLVRPGIRGSRPRYSPTLFGDVHPRARSGVPPRPSPLSLWVP